MRKLLSFILAFTMIFTSVAASAAMSAEKIPAFLDKAGIIAEGTFANDTKVITRGEFAQMVAKLINIDNYKGLSTTQVFKDIPVDDPLFDVTTLLNQMYFVVGDGNGYFEPDENITAEAACKILVNLMGDQYFAQYYGGYIPAAAAKGLLSGVELDANSNITVKAAMRLIYNTMVADISNSNLYDGNATTNNPQAEMFMSKRLGIYKIDGTVTDDGISNLAGNTQIEKGYVKIDQYVFENKTGMEDLLGYPVEGFYRHDKVSGENILIYAYINENKTNVLELDDSDIASYSNLKYEYYIDEDQYETEEAYLNPNYRIIYNGHVYSAETKESTFTKTQTQMLKPENGKVKAIDTNGDSYYDIVMVTDYTVVVVGAIDCDNYVVYGDTKFTNVSVDLTNAKNDLTITNAQGMTFAIETINPGSVLSIAESADGKMARIKYSNTKVTGKLATTDGDYYTVDETEYKATKQFKDYLVSKPNAVEIGDTAVFYLTFDDEIVYCVQEAEASIKAGYFVNLHYKSSMDDTLTLRILTNGNSFDDFEVASRVIVDGKLYKDRYQLANDLVAFKDYIIRYRVNGDGLINYIDTPYDAATGNPNYLTESDDTLFIIKGMHNQLCHILPNGTITDKCATNAGTKVYKIITADIEKSFATTYTNANLTNQYPLTGYATDTNSIFAEYIVSQATTTNVEPGVDNTGRYAVVLKITDAVNNDGEAVKKIKLTSTDAYVEYLTESLDTLKCTCGQGGCATNPVEVGVGDIITYTLNSNVINNGCVFVCYDYSEGKVINPGSSHFMKSGRVGGPMHAFDPAQANKATNGLTDTGCVLPFYINRIQNNVAEFVFDYWPFLQYKYGSYTETLEPASAQPTKRFMVLDNTNIVKINTKAGTLLPIRTNEIKTYNNGNGVIEKGVVFLSYGRPTIMYFFK